MRRQAGPLAEIPVAQARVVKRASGTNWAGSCSLHVYKQAIFSRRLVLERSYVQCRLIQKTMLTYVPAYQTSTITKT